MSYTEGSSIAANASELDKLIQGFEFENQQLVKLIEKENQEIEAAECDVKEKYHLINQLEEKISELDEDTKSAHKQFTLNRENCESLRKTAKVLGEHEVALHQKLNSQVETRLTERKEHNEVLQHYTSIVEDYKQKYRTFPFVADIEEITNVVTEMEAHLKEAEETIEKLQIAISKILERNEETEPLQNMKKFVVYLSKIMFSTNQIIKEIKVVDDEKKKINKEIRNRETQITKEMENVHLVMNEDVVSLSDIDVTEDVRQIETSSALENQENCSQATLISMYSDKADDGVELMNNRMYGQAPVSCEDKIKTIPSHNQAEETAQQQIDTPSIPNQQKTKRITTLDGETSRVDTNTSIISGTQVSNSHQLLYTSSSLQPPSAAPTPYGNKANSLMRPPIAPQQRYSYNVPRLNPSSVKQPPRLHSHLNVQQPVSSLRGSSQFSVPTQLASPKAPSQFNVPSHLASPKVSSQFSLPSQSASPKVPSQLSIPSQLASPRVPLQFSVPSSLASPRVQSHISVPSSNVARQINSSKSIPLTKAAATSVPSVYVQTPCNPPENRQTNPAISIPRGQTPVSLTVNRPVAQKPSVSKVAPPIMSQNRYDFTSKISPDISCSNVQRTVSADGSVYSNIVLQATNINSPRLKHLEPTVTQDSHAVPTTPKQLGSRTEGSTTRTPPHSVYQSIEEFRSPGANNAPKTPEGADSYNTTSDPVSPFDLEKHLQKIQQLTVSPKGPLLTSRPMFSWDSDIPFQDQENGPDSYEMTTFNFSGGSDSTNSPKNDFGKKSSGGSFSFDFGGEQFDGMSNKPSGNPTLMSLFGGSGDNNMTSMETEPKSPGFSFSFNSPTESDSGSSLKLF